MQELNDKQWWHLSLDDREEEELAPVYGDEIVVWGLQDRGYILRIHCLLLGLEEVITYTSADNALPVFLQEDISRVINKKQTVDHLSCNNEVVVIDVSSTVVGTRHVKNREFCNLNCFEIICKSKANVKQRLLRSMLANCQFV